MPAAFPPQPARLVSSSPRPVGLGWRHPHYGELLERRPQLAFLEVHSENFFADGGAALAVLEQGRAHYEVSLHGVGLGLGSASGIDDWHLARLTALVDRIEPMLVSDHACFARAALPGHTSLVHAADLLPIPFSRESLGVMCRNVQEVQERLQRPLLVENLSAYIQCPQTEMSEAEFLNALARTSGCQLLLDVNNLYVNAGNAVLRGECTDAVAAVRDMLDAIESEHVREIHLAGHSRVNDRGLAMLIDDHGHRVSKEVWALYAHASERFEAAPTLIEWDTALPTLDVLLDEVERARRPGVRSREAAWT